MRTSTRKYQAAGSIWAFPGAVDTYPTVQHADLARKGARRKYRGQRDRMPCTYPGGHPAFRVAQEISFRLTRISLRLTRIQDPRLTCIHCYSDRDFANMNFFVTFSSCTGPRRYRDCGGGAAFQILSTLSD
jgi:hypothetical protein